MAGGSGVPQREMFGICRGSGSGFVITSIGIGVKPKNCSGYCTIGIRDCNFGISGLRTIVRVRGHLPAGHPGVPPDLPRTSSCSPGGIPCPGAAREITRTIVCLPDGPGHGPATSARRPAWIKKFILGVDTLYIYGILWDYSLVMRRRTMVKTPQVKPDWNTGIYIGNGVVAASIGALGRHV